MAETVSIRGENYLKRDPWGVVGLTLITFGIYFYYWYYQANQEIKRFTNDPTISPTRSLMAILLGWIIIVPPFIAMYNTGKHTQELERSLGLTSTIEPPLVVVFYLTFGVINGFYIQDHLNNAWERAVIQLSLPPAPPAALPPIPPSPA